MGNISPPKKITIPERVRSTHISHCRGAHQKVSLGRNLKIRILAQGKSLEAVEDLLNHTMSPSQIPTNLEKVEKICDRSQYHKGGHGQAVVN